LKRKQQQQGPTKKTPGGSSNTQGEGAKPDFVFTSGTAPLDGMEEWYVDSGATKHMAFDYTLFRISGENYAPACLHGQQ